MSRLTHAGAMLKLRLRRQHDPREGEPGASPGQIIVLFAVMSTALFGRKMRGCRDDPRPASRRGFSARDRGRRGP